MLVTTPVPPDDTEYVQTEVLALSGEMVSWVYVGASERVVAAEG
jgi:hypothetical protein